jgi:hypothetical protein
MAYQERLSSMELVLCVFWKLGCVGMVTSLQAEPHRNLGTIPDEIR